MNNMKVKKNKIIDVLNSFKETFYEYSLEKMSFEEVSKYINLNNLYTIENMFKDFINYNYINKLNLCCDVLLKLKYPESLEKIDEKFVETINEKIFNEDGIIITTSNNDNLLLIKVKENAIKEFLTILKYIFLYIPKDNKLIFTIEDIIYLFSMLEFINLIEDDELEELNIYNVELLKILNTIKDKIIEKV